MKPKLIVVDTSEGIKNLQSYLADKEYIAFDCETTGLTQHDQVIGFSVCAEESVAYYVILAEWSKNTNSLGFHSYHKAAADLISSIRDKNLIMHNGVFDCMMVEAYFKVRLIDSLHTDTMALAHLLDENRKKGLKELASALFGEESTTEQAAMKASIIANGGSATKSNYELYKADARLIAEYGAKDAWLTYKLFLELVPELYNQKLDKFFYEDESMPLLRGPTYDMNTTGLQVDLKALISLKKILEAECAEAKAFIYQEIDKHIKDKYPGTNTKNRFNIGSNQQLSWLLFFVLKIEFGTLTKTGKNICKELGMELPYTNQARANFLSVIPEGPWKYLTVDKKILTKLAPKFKWIEKLLEYQRKNKLLNTYVKGIEKKEQYGIIRPSFLQSGTTSGRYSSRNPNFQNLPRDDKRIKTCIVPRPGRVFVGADYSQLEPRVFAYFSGDARLREAFSGNDDFYSVLGKEVYDKQDCLPKKEGANAFGSLYPKLRQDAKVFALASTYGATGAQLAPLMGKSIEAAQNDIDLYFEKFPSVRKMMLNAHEQAKTKGFVTNYFGRPRRIPEALHILKYYGKQSHAELPYKARTLLNLAVNHTIQSTAASIVNRAAIVFWRYYENADCYCKIVLQVHDSLIVECDESEAENVTLLLQNAMETTTQLEGIRLEAIPKIGRDLSKV